MIENWNDCSEGMPEALGYSRTLIAIEGGCTFILECTAPLEH
jgi:hypothetical protein